MKKLASILLLSTALTLTGCGQAGEQWMNPDKTFSLFDQPDVKGVNDTQEAMAKEAVTNGDYLRGAQFYQQLVSSARGTPEQVLRYKIGLADATRRLGDTQSSLTMYEQLHTELPTNLDIAEGRALTLMAAGKVADAGRAFSEIIEKDPKRWRSLNALGILFVSKNMIPEAMAYYTEALNQSPDNPAVLNNVGLSQAVDRNFPRAIEALEHASRVSKVGAQRRQVEMNLALVQGVSGDMESARATASKYMEGAALDNNLGLYAHLAKDDNLAKSYLNMALSQSPTYYQRAWENLESVTESVGSDSTRKKRAAVTKGKVLKVEPAPKAPEIAAEVKKEAVPPAAPKPTNSTPKYVEPLVKPPEPEPAPVAEAEEKTTEAKAEPEKKEEAAKVEESTSEKKEEVREEKSWFSSIFDAPAEEVKPEQTQVEKKNWAAGADEEKSDAAKDESKPDEGDEKKEDAAAEEKKTETKPEPFTAPKPVKKPEPKKPEVKKTEKKSDKKTEKKPETKKPEAKPPVKPVPKKAEDAVKQTDLPPLPPVKPEPMPKPVEKTDEKKAAAPETPPPGATVITPSEGD